MDEEYFYEPFGPDYERPPSGDCPNCPCHTARVCEDELWGQASRPTHHDGTPYLKRCPCEMATLPPRTPKKG